MDQFLNMGAIATFGAGQLIRADRANTAQLKEAIETLTLDPKFAIRALELARGSKAEDPAILLTQHIFAQHKKARLAPFETDTSNCHDEPPTSFWRRH